MTTFPLLPALSWETSYRHEDGDLVEKFYVPALSCAVRYDRMTGYFTADALALAARGIERLIHNWGRMRLIVGCTLGPDEVKAIEAGYDLREQISEVLGATTLIPPNLTARRGLEALAWMIGHERLDIRVAIPCGPGRKPIAAPGIYHEKVGIITDAEGNSISFSGSINETQGGWINNRESFHLHCSWEGGREFKHVQDEIKAFTNLWTDKSECTITLDFPQAAREKLLEFMPKDDRFAKPPRAVQVAKSEEEEIPEPRLMPDELRRLVWGFFRHAPTLATGTRVGEATSAIQPWPHQIRTFTRMLENWPFRLLISDEVGLGKTISAGLLIRQAWIAGLARRILIMVPAGVLIQWQNELYEKFNLNIPIYDGKALTWRKTHGWQGPHVQSVERKEWHREPFVLCSSHLMRRRDRAAELIEAEPWDLLVLDEAHHARRKAPGAVKEGGPNQLLRLMERMESRTRALLLLTATPMQVHPVEVWDLLKLLGLPKQWESGAFVRYFELAGGNPNKEELEFLAGMFKATEAGFGAVEEADVEAILPEVTPVSRRAVLKALRSKSRIPLKRLGSEERKAALEALLRFSPVRYRMSRHTRSLLRRYYEAGLIASPIATRDVRDFAVELTPAEREIYEAVEDYISSTYNKASATKKGAVGFVMTIYRRRLASCFFALKKTLTGRLARVLEPVVEDLSQNELAGDVMDDAEAFALSREALTLEEGDRIKELLKMIAKLGTDTKVKRLKSELEQVFADGYDSAIVFTQYTDTMNYLKDFLGDELPDIPLACYSSRGGLRRDTGGGWTAMSKEQIKRAFKKKVVRLLICTDAAGEGLNLQSCGVVVNYDLPWNPMKVEQRIGRIDRIGQAHRVIRVINLAYKDTVEADVYFALGERINLFQGIVGKLQPILSRLPQEFERVALERSDCREAAKQQFLSDVEQMIVEAENVGFDIDDVAAEALSMPELAPPALTLANIESTFSRDDLRPAGVGWRRLDEGSYAMTLPGVSADLRVTADAEVFEDHCESHEFLSPGGHVFERIVAELYEQTDDAGEEEIGLVWLARGQSPEIPTRYFVFTSQGECEVGHFDDLMDALDDLGSPGRPRAAQDAGVRLERLV